MRLQIERVTPPQRLPLAVLRVASALRRPVTARGIDYKGITREVEVALCRKALEAAHWNICRAADILGVRRDLLRYRMKKYNIVPPIEIHAGRPADS